jgi:hypothetical protein
MKPRVCATFALALFVGGAGFAKDPAPPAAERPWSPPRLGEYERELAQRATRATKPELLQAQQQTAQSAFDLEAAMGDESDAEIALVESLGILPTTRVRIADIANKRLPAEPARSVDALIDLALSQRPDLVAKLASLRSKEAEVRKARADFYPKVAIDAHVGRLKLDVSVADSDYFSDDHTVYGATIAVDVPLFDGFARREKLRLAEADLRAAESELAGARDAAVREVWNAFTDFKTALRNMSPESALRKRLEGQRGKRNPPHGARHRSGGISALGTGAPIPRDGAASDPKRAAEPSDGIIGLRAVVIEEDVAEAAIAKEGAVEYPNIGRCLDPARSLQIEFPQLLQLSILFLR